MKADKGAVVIYKGQPAVIESRVDDKYQIALESGTKKVREKDFTLISNGPVSSVAVLTQKELPPADFAEAADFFGGDETTFYEICELVWGTVPPDLSWKAWQIVSTSPWFVCTTPDQPVQIRNQEEVNKILNAAAEKSAEEETRAAFITRLKQTASGKENGIIRPDDDRFLQEIEALALGTSSKAKSFTQAGLAENPGTAHRILLACGYWDHTRNPWPYRHGLTLSSPNVEITPPDLSADRLDLTHLDAWAIDNEWSSDPDDAISIDGDALWVHVADPAETVTPDSNADTAARSRGSTLYVPEGASRMLPDAALEYYGLGLAPRSPALSFKITFTDTGAIDDVSIHRTVIHVTRKTYHDVSSAVDDATFAPFFRLSERNIARRKAAGAVFIELPEIHLSVHRDDSHDCSISIDQIEADPASAMVREMMLIAGEAAARYAFKNRIPFQFVSQDTPEIPATLPEGLAGEYRKRRCMRARKVGTTPADHAGLGLGMYAQVTSPLRRYGDLVVHQQLHRYITGQPLMDTDDMLMRIAAGDAAARECTLAERESNQHWKLVYLSQNPQWTGTGIIVEKTGTVSTILIPSLAMEERVSKLNGDVNDEVTVTVSNISIPDQRISFSFT